MRGSMADLTSSPISEAGLGRIPSLNHHRPGCGCLPKLLLLCAWSTIVDGTAKDYGVLGRRPFEAGQFSPVVPSSTPPRSRAPSTGRCPRTIGSASVNISAV